MSTDDELKELLDHTAKEISRLSSNPRTWVSWLVYLLSKLEGHATDVRSDYKDMYRDMLAALEDMIRNRRRTGGW